MSNNATNDAHSSSEPDTAEQAKLDEVKFKNHEFFGKLDFCMFYNNHIDLRHFKIIQGSIYRYRVESREIKSCKDKI